MAASTTRMVQKEVIEPSAQWLSRLPSRVNKAVEEVNEVLEDGLDTTRRTLKLVRKTAREMSDDAVHTVKKYPLQTVAITFGVALGVGVLAGWLVTRTPKPKGFLERVGAVSRSLFA
jgi:ElaB/YqjD/DUF883 family membrane-anchored ribosome-binding protein